MKFRILIVLSIFGLLISGCDLISEQVVGKIQDVIETNQPQVVVTKEVVVKTVEQVIVTNTPAPTPTQTPVPSFLGTPVQPDPAMQRAVAVSLLALGTDFEIRLFTRAPNGELIVWVRDNNYPDTLLCGAPLYFPGLGSLLVLTTTHFYSTINQHQTFPSSTGCVAISLSKGKSQVQKILEYHQGLYNALRDTKRYSSADGVYYDVLDFISKHKSTPYPYELNLVLLPMAGDDLGRTSINLECPRVSNRCVDFFRYNFTGDDISYNNSTSRHVPLAYARFFERTSYGSELNLLSDSGKKMTASAPSGSLANKNPLSLQETLTIWFHQRLWEPLVYSSAFTAGLGTIFPKMDTRVISNNPAFVPLLPFTGVNHAVDEVLAQNWNVIGNFMDGKTKDVPTAALETYTQYARTAIKNTYFEFVIIEQK